MEAILKYNLPEENHEFQRAVNGTKLFVAMGEFDHWLRSQIKYENLPGEEVDILDKVRTKFWEIIKDEDLAGLINE